jgi:hypothetical protein
MIENLILSVLRKEQKSEITVPRAVRQVLNNQVAKKYNRPIVWELRQALRAKYPQSKFQSVYLSKNPLGNEFMVHYASKDIHLPFPAFCAHFDMDTSTIDTEMEGITKIDNLLIINILCRRTEKKRFFAQLKTLFTFAAIKKKLQNVLFLKEWHISKQFPQNKTYRKSTHFLKLQTKNVYRCTSFFINE